MYFGIIHTLNLYPHISTLSDNPTSHTLITKNFGRFKFRTNVCQKLKTSEIFVSLYFGDFLGEIRVLNIEV